MRDILNTLKSRMLSTFMTLLAVGAVVFLGLCLSVTTVISTILGPTQTRIIRLKNLGITKYEYLANFFNENKYGSLFPHNHTYEVYQLGSEEIKTNQQFQTYRGKLDLVFHKSSIFCKRSLFRRRRTIIQKIPRIPVLGRWFLRPTLETCIEYLNQTDICFGILLMRSLVLTCYS